MRRLLPRVALTLSLSLAGAGAWALPAAAEGEFNTVGSFKLPGALEVITSEDHAGGKVTVDTWVKAGSAADFTGYPGLAYATAHALWHGGTPSLADRLKALGGTSFVEVGRDATHFSATVPAAQLTAAMNLIGAAFAQPTVAPAALAEFKARLQAEYRRQRAEEGGWAVQGLLGELYGPEVGHAPIGQSAALEALGAADLQAFYDRHYVPSQVKVVLVGDFDTGKTIGQVVRSYAAHLKRTAATGAPPARPHAPEPRARAMGRQARLAVGARGPAIGDQREQAAMAVLAAILEDSRLPAALGGQAQHPMATWLPFKGPGALVVTAEAAPASAAAVEQAVRDALAQLREAPVSLEEHARAMARVVKAYEAANDTQPEQAATLGFFTAVAGDPLIARTYPEVVRQVSRNDLMEAAQAYLTPDAVKVVVLAP